MPSRLATGPRNLVPARVEQAREKRSLSDQTNNRLTQEGNRIMAETVPHNALIAVADGVGARFFRNLGNASHIELSADGELKPSNLLDDGPSGLRPSESSHQETDEATFAKQLSKELYRRAHKGDFAALVLIADPQTLGQIRPLLHKEVQERVTAEFGKTLTKASASDIQKALSALSH